MPIAETDVCKMLQSKTIIAARVLKHITFYYSVMFIDLAATILVAAVLPCPFIDLFLSSSSKCMVLLVVISTNL